MLKHVIEQVPAEPGSAYRVLYRERRWYTGNRKNDNPYYLFKASSTGTALSYEIDAPNSAVAYDILSGGARYEVENHLANRMKNAAYDQSGLGIALAQMRHDATSLTNMAMNVYRFANDVRKGHFAKAYGRCFGRSNRRIEKHLANGWLGYNYGVKQFFGDMYDLTQAFTEPKSVMIQATAHKRYYGGSTNDEYTIHTGGRSRAWVYIEDDAMYLAEKNGLLNPLVVANDAIPFSFIADWFTNWSQYLGQLSDFAGLRVERPLTTIFQQGFGYVDHSFDWNGQHYPRQFTHRVVSLERRLAMPRVHFMVDTHIGISRAVSAMSLAIQQLNLHLK